MDLYRLNNTKILLVIILATIPLAAFSLPHKEKHFGSHAPFHIADLPAGRVRSKLDRLPEIRKQKALKWLHRFSFTEHDLKYLQIDNEGGVLYSDTVLPDEGSAATLSSIEQPQAITQTDAFTLHSKPGAPNVVYLDFDGHVITSTAWNAYIGVATLNAKSYDLDGAPSTFSSTELNQIAEIWHRMAEDYAPFNIDVTTELPASFGPTVGRVLITQDVDANGNNMPFFGAGGVAYVNVWGLSDFASYYSPALVYYNRLGFGHPPYVAEAGSHEMGHILGLSHDGFNDGTTSQDYYAGQGTGFVSWAPIMGVGYYNNVTQWSKGEYPFATQLQDEINLIGTKLSYRTDDHGNNTLSSTSLSVNATGTVTASNPEIDPHNTNGSNKGIIETRSDVDYFTFDAGTGAININVTPAWEAFYRTATRGANLDVQATLYDQNGTQVAQNDPFNETDAVISATVSGGHYYLAVSGIGNSVTPYSNYGSLGQYFISGSIAPGTVTDNTPPFPNPMTFAVAPYLGTSTNSITMKASTATDASGGIQYHFVCTLPIGGSGCVDAPWQTSSTYTATGLQSGTSYSYQVQAKDSLGNMTSFSTTRSATSATALSARPTDLTGSKASIVRLNWGAVTGATSYEIFRCRVTTSGGVTTCTYGTIAVRTTTTNTYGYASTSTVYGYKVRAVNSAGRSGYSNEVRL
jgi:hypothetical protein